MKLFSLALSVALALAGCVSSPAPEPELLRGDSRIAYLQQALDAALAAESGKMRRMSVEVTDVQEAGGSLAFYLQIHREASFGRAEQDVSLVTRCAPADLDHCRQRALEAVRIAATAE